MTTASSPALPARAPRLPALERRLAPRPKVRRRWSGVLIWAIAFVSYSTTGLLFNLRYNYTFNDGLSRVANASYVLFSRDPHLAAVGFVWNPLPSLMELPIIAFRDLWQPLVTQGAAGVFMSAAMMAGCVVEIRTIARDRVHSRAWSTFLTLAFALNPMIILYGGNGMSEAPYLLFTIWSVRRLIRWIEHDEVLDLAAAGVGFGLDYLTRYESIAAGVAAIVLVMLITYLRTGARGRTRVINTVMDGAIVGFPITLMFIYWALASYLITGSAFAQFSSVYGNSSQAALGGLSDLGGYQGVNTFYGLGALGVVLQHLLAMEPLLPVILVVGLGLALVRSDPTVLAPVFVFGAELAFEAITYLDGTTFPWLRFYLMSVPLAVTVVNTFHRRDELREVWTPFPPTVGSWRYRGPGGRRRKIFFRKYRLSAWVISVACLAPSLPVTMSSVLNPQIGLQEYALRSVLDSARYPVKDVPPFFDYVGARKMANYLDHMKNRDGAILADTFLAWPVVMASTNPSQFFVITSDLDFAAALNDPKRYHVRYFLVPDETTSFGSLDAINRRYPNLWFNGGGIATLVKYVPQTGYGYAWKLYRLNYR